MTRINVTKTYLPPLEEYEGYLQKIWKSGQLTNQGPLLKELESGLRSYLSADNFHFVSNGTTALQLALNALDITGGEVITTPFSYVATVSSILWERCKPVFVDIEPDTFCIDASKIEAAITTQTRAIMPVHVFGNPCDVEAIGDIAARHGLKVIYDGAHAFGVEYRGKPLLNYGDISICSFHATKLFHTIEGGGLVVSSRETSDKLELIKRFGHNGDEHFMLGINAKASEFNAAMGLCNLPHIDEIISRRQKVTELYDAALPSHLRPKRPAGDVKRNYAYYPIVMRDEATLLKTIKALNDDDIFPRRYFYPSLNALPYIQDRQSCPVSERIAGSVMCLPLYPDLAPDDVKRIGRIISEVDAS